MGDIEQTEADLRVASDNSQSCKKQLDAKTVDMTAKDQQVAALIGNVATLTEEKTTIQEQVTQLTAQLEEANTAKTALQAERDKLATELAAAKKAAAGAEKDGGA